jgi:glyoxylase-like metal-dependent hydrolase (beta-lactamase superfamily II)
VSENVYKIFGAGGNTTAFVRSDGVVLVDTKLANNGAAILAKVREFTDKPVTMIINTHSHPDHMGSNNEINTARGSVQIVAQANSARRINAMPNQAQVATPSTTSSRSAAAATGSISTGSAPATPTATR